MALSYAGKIGPAVTYAHPEYKVAAFTHWDALIQSIKDDIANGAV